MIEALLPITMQKWRLNYFPFPSSFLSIPSLGPYFNLTVAAAGVGVLSYPYCVSTQGVILCATLTLVFGLLSMYTGLVLCRYAELKHAVLTECGSEAYHTLMLVCLGPKFYVAALFFVVFGSLGALISFLIIIADLMTPVLRSAAGTGAKAFIGERWFSVILFGGLVALPLSKFSKIHSLRGSSFLALMGAVVTVAAVVAEAGGNAQEKPILFSDGPYQWVLGVPITVFALGNHLQVRNEIRH